MILVTGPTGSGKTTTLYAALRRLKERGVNIVTVEDPIEYRLPGIVQVQVNEKAGLTFASALRSIMRQDPDVVLIGEIRDRETAEIAIQASLTGHLVLSTLHTNDAPSAVTRLIDIGVASYKIATAVKGVLAQRLVRRICASCRGRTGACDECGGSGFHGRLALVEVLDRVARVRAARCRRRIDGAHRRGGAQRRDAIAVEVGCRARGGGSHDASRRCCRVATPDDEPAIVSEPRARGARPAPRRRCSSCSAAMRSESAKTSTRSWTVRCAVDVVFRHGTRIEVGTVDVFVIRPLASGWRVLALQRGNDTRCPSAWETVHGHIEPGEEPEQAAVREVREESGLARRTPIQRPRAAVLPAPYAHAAARDRLRRVRRRAGRMW